MDIGLSPAFMFANYGEDIDHKGVLWCVRKAAELGFKSLQLEFFLKKHLDNYKGNKGKEISKVYKDLGLKNTTFIPFGIREEFFSFDKKDEKIFFECFKETVEVCLNLDVIDIVSLSSYLPKQIFSKTEDTYAGAGIPLSIKFTKELSFEKMWEIMVERFNKVLEIINDTELYITVEPIALTAISSSDSFLRLCDNLENCEKLGLSLDTGHLFVQKEPLDIYIKKINKKIKSTHISDNNGITPDHLPPGEGRINWQSVINSLKEIGYDGSLDIEINDVRDGTVDATYLRSKEFLLKFL